MEIKKEYMPYMTDIFRALPQTVFLKDTEGRYAFTTKVCDLINAGPNGTIVGKRDYEIQYDKELGMRYYNEDMEIIRTGKSTHTTDLVVVEGERHYIEVIKNPIYNDEGEVIGIIGICNDVTELIFAREKYEQLSLHDSMTGLYNRNYMVKFDFDNEKSLPCSYILCDCNNLKKINDVYGHSAGDQYLNATAKLLKAHAAERSVVIRWGGDEFLVITPSCSAEEHEAQIRTIREAQKQFSAADPDAGISIGGVLRTQLTVSENEILKIADKRMYENKVLRKKEAAKPERIGEANEECLNLRVAICDDESQICEVMRDKLQKYYFSSNINLSVKTFSSGEQVLESDLGRIDVLFLDVDMPGLDGLKTAKAIRKKNKDMIIIFLTAYSEFVFESFKVDAFRFLIKPVKDSELTETLEAVQKKLYEPEEYLSFQFQNEIYSIKYSDILYIEGMYIPKNVSGKLPAIAVAGPFGAVKEQASGLYAQTMAERGFLTIAFDPSYTGESGGEPRYVASPDINTEDFSAAVDFLSVQDNVDPEKIGIIGICGWGGMALNAASMDTRIKATVTSTMYDMSRVTANGYFDAMDEDQRYR